MIENILTLLHGIVLLVFGVSLTAAIAGIRFTKRNTFILFCVFALSGVLQLIITFTVSEAIVWKLYPLITHLPLILLLRLAYHKPTVTSAASVFTAYLCCQPAKWFGVLTRHLTGSQTAEQVVHILCLLAVGYVTVFYLSSYFSQIFNKDRRSVCIFGLIPTVYYIFDYVTAIYTDLWLSNVRAVMEFLPFFLAITYMIFCLVYYKEYEQKADSQRNEQIIRITVEQQTKEIQAVKQMEQELRMLRHDMRMLLSSLAVSVENGEAEKAQEMISVYIARIDGTKLERFCSNNVVNYVISDYAARCKAAAVPLVCAIDLQELSADEIMFSSILSNALDNALNAQKLLPEDKRCIKLMLKNFGNKLLLSVKNPIDQPVVFSDGLPVSGKNGHGYGTQSIRYLTEQLGGNCQFSTQNNTFILRIVL